MNVLEIGKSYIEKEYNGNALAAVAADDGVLWDSWRIKNAFRLGKGTRADFRKYRENNRAHSVYYDLEKRRFI